MISVVIWILVGVFPNLSSAHTPDLGRKFPMRIYDVPHESLRPFGDNFIPAWVYNGRSLNIFQDRHNARNFVYAPYDNFLDPDDKTLDSSAHPERVQHVIDKDSNSFFIRNTKLMAQFNVRVSIAPNFQDHIRPGFSTMTGYQERLKAALSSSGLNRMPITTEIRVQKSCDTLLQDCDSAGGSYNSINNLLSRNPTPPHHNQITDFDFLIVNPEADFEDLVTKLTRLSKLQTALKPDLEFIRSQGILFESFDGWSSIYPYSRAEYFVYDEETLTCHFNNVKVAARKLASYLRTNPESLEVDYSALNYMDKGYSFTIGLGVTDDNEVEYHSIGHFMIDSLALLPCDEDPEMVGEAFIKYLLKDIPLRKAHREVPGNH